MAGVAAVAPVGAAQAPTVALPSPLNEYLALLTTWVYAMTGDPVAVTARSVELERLGIAASEAAQQLGSETRTMLASWTAGSAREAFAGSESEAEQQLREVGSNYAAAGKAVQDCASVLRTASRRSTEIRAHFLSEALALLQYVTAVSTASPEIAAQILAREGRAIGERAVELMLRLDDRVDSQLEDCADRLLAARPTTSFLHRTLRRLGTDVERFGWEPGFNFSDDRKGFVGIGAMFTPALTGAIMMGNTPGLGFGEGYLRGLARVPGNGLNHVLIAGVLDPRVTGVHYLNNAALDRLTFDTATSGLMVATDQVALKARQALLTTTGVNVNLNSGLRSGVLASIPYAIDAGNWVADQVTTKPAMTDSSNWNYHADVLSHATALGTGFAGPIWHQSRNPTATGLGFGAMFAQGAMSRYAFGPPPPHPDPVYNGLHDAGQYVAGTLGPYVDTVGSHPYTQQVMKDASFVSAALDYDAAAASNALARAAMDPTAGHHAPALNGRVSMLMGVTPYWVAPEMDIAIMSQARATEAAEQSALERMHSAVTAGAFSYVLPQGSGQ